MSVVSQVTDAEFETEVLKKEGSVVVVDFYADWCGPCKAMAPALDELAANKPNIIVKKINVDNNPDSAQKYGIRGIPTILFFKDGEVKTTKVGAQNIGDLTSAVEEL